LPQERSSEQLKILVPLSILSGPDRPGFCRRDCPIEWPRLSAARLEIAIPGVRWRFRGCILIQVDQSLWLILLFALLFLGGFVQQAALQFLSAAPQPQGYGNDLSNKIHANGPWHRIMNIISLGARPNYRRCCSSQYQENI